MAKELEFEEHTAQVPDADGDNHPHVVTAAKVTKENYRAVGGENRTVNVVGSVPVTLKPGHVVVKTDNPNEYEVHTSDQWDKLGYKGKSHSSPAKATPAKKAAPKRSLPAKAPAKAVGK
jgi:hypothetical protein